MLREDLMNEVSLNSVLNNECVTRQMGHGAEKMSKAYQVREQLGKT